MQVDFSSKEEKEDEEEQTGRASSADQLTSTSDGERSSELSSPKQEVTRATSPSPAQATAPPPRVTSPVTARVTSPNSQDPSSRPASVQSLRSSSQPLLHSKHYKQFERTTTPNR